MQFYWINICENMIFRLCIAYNKYEMTKIGNKTRENCKFSNNFAVDCMVEKVLILDQIFEIEFLMELHVLRSHEFENRVYSS